MLPLYLFKQLTDSHGPRWQPYCKPVHAVILQGNTLISDNPEERAGQPSRNTKFKSSSPETQSPCWPTVSVNLSRASALRAVGSGQGLENCFEPPGTRTTPGFYRLLGSLGPQSPLCLLEILESEACSLWVMAEETHKPQDILPHDSTAHSQANLTMSSKKMF